MPDDTMLDRKQSHVVVIGGGWAGWGAAKSLCEAGVDVTLIDGMFDPTGSQPITTKTVNPLRLKPGAFGRTIPTSMPSQKSSKLALFSLTLQPVLFGHPMDWKRQLLFLETHPNGQAP